MRRRGAFPVPAFLLLACSVAIAQLPKEFSLYNNRVLFTMNGGGSLPDLSLFRDPVNNAIGVACINNQAIEDLDKLAIPDLSQRFKLLEQANDLRIVDGKCSLTFPVLVGQQRRKFQAVVDKGAERLVPKVMALKQRLQGGIPSRPDILFHLLWSRVIDDAWADAWKAAFKSDGPPNATWVIHPHQPFDVGTNYGSVSGYGSYALTWSDALRPQLQETSDSIIDAFRVAWGKEVSPSDVARLQRFGVLTADSKSHVFAFHVDDPTDRLLDELRSEYAALAATAYDFPAMGKQFRVPTDQIFLILLHETAYAIFGRLNRARQLEIPAILQADGNPRGIVDLISLKLGKPPGPDSDAMYLFVKTGWRGNAQTVAAFRRVVELEPGNLQAWLFLGFSLYEIKDYRSAIEAFDQLVGHTGNDPHLRGWGRLWSAHMYDLLGERERALTLYRAVAESDDKETMMFGQYDIGPVTASDWAKERIATPFTRR